MRDFVGPLLAGAALHLVTPAGAQTDEERAGARAAAVSGITAFKDKRYAEAIDLLNRAENLVHAPVHLLYLARSHAALGQLVKAREYYLKLSRERLADNAPQVFKDAVASAESELADVEAKLPYVNVVVENAGPKDVRITRNGVRVPPALVGVPHPVDPGEHTFQAFADGMQSDPERVVIEPSSKPTVVLTLQPSATAAGGDPGASGPGSAAQASLTSDDALAASESSSAMRIAAYAGFGLAAVGATVGTIFLLKSASTQDEADDLFATYGCGEQGSTDCTPDRRDRIDALDGDAADQETLAAIGYVAGGVGLVGGITLLILSSSSDEAAARRARPGVHPVLGLGYAGISGRF